jgi:hypothetical protein
VHPEEMKALFEKHGVEIVGPPLRRAASPGVP